MWKSGQGFCKCCIWEVGCTIMAELVYFYMLLRTCLIKRCKSWTRGGRIGITNLRIRVDYRGVYPCQWGGGYIYIYIYYLRSLFLSAVDRVWLRDHRLQKTHKVFARTASLCLHTKQQGHVDFDVCTPVCGIRHTLDFSHLQCNETGKLYGIVLHAFFKFAFWIPY
jgi:hypothetical protein